jgi:hypothetical protein
MNVQLFKEITPGTVLHVNSDEKVNFWPVYCFYCSICDNTIRLRAFFETTSIDVLKRRHNAYFTTLKGDKLYLDSCIQCNDDDSTEHIILYELSFTKELINDDTEMNKLFNPPNN